MPLFESVTIDMMGVW